MSDHAIMGALLAAREYLRSCANPSPSYGYFLGGDPRDFAPDPECNTPEELEAHKVACAAWERGERPPIEAHHHETSEHEGSVVCVSYSGSFGLGVTSIRDEEAEDVLEQIDAAIAAMSDGVVR